MRIPWHVMAAAFMAATCAVVLPAALGAQSASPPSSKSTRDPVSATGCVSGKPDAAGRYTLSDTEGVTQYRLTGKRLTKFAGQRVEVIGRGPGGLTIRGGLVGPMGGARGVAIDPAQESVRRQPGGGGTGVGPDIPEFRVAQVRAMPGVCEEPAAR